MYISRTVPYRKTSETLNLEKRIDALIKTKPFPQEKKIGEKLFNVFLKHIPKDKQDYYKREGIPYGKDGIYTLKVK
jgi:hypothetical protein